MNSGLGAPKNVAEKQSEVSRELERLGKACVQLHEAIEHVKVRFASVSSRAPGNPTCEAEKSGYSCELAEHIATHRSRVEDAAIRLEEFRKRCEL